MGTKEHRRMEAGFGIGGLIVALLLIIGIAVAARFVMRANEDNKRQASLIDKAIHGDGEPNDPSDDDFIPESPEPSWDERPIRSVRAEPQVAEVVLVAELPGTYKGTCYAEVSLPDGTEYRRYTEPLEFSNTCRITVPRERLAGKTWRYVMSFQSADGNYRGDHAAAELSL